MQTTIRQAFQTKSQVEATRIDLNDKGMTKMLLKFCFTNKAHIPAGIPEQVRKDDFSVDQKHAARASTSELGQIGRVREGRVDTGRQIINNLDFVQVRILRTSLRNAGCGLVSAHWFYNQFKGKYFVVLEVAVGSNPHRYDETTLGKDTLEGIRQLSRYIWQYCHVWENRPETTGTDGVYTVNLVGLQPVNARTKNMLAVREGYLMPIPFVETED